MNWIELDSVALRYDVSGRGQPLVLIHELGGSINSWDEASALLQSDFSIVRLDLRGAGMSTKVRGILNIDDLADDIARLLDVLAIAKPCAVAGISLGAAIAARFANRHAKRVGAYVGLGPIAHSPPENRDGLMAHADRVEQQSLAGMVEASFGVTYPESLRALSNGRFQSARARWLTNDPASFAAYYRMFAELDTRPDLQALKCPMLITGATLDARFSPEVVKAYADLNSAARYLVLETGHLYPVQTPELVSTTMRAFLTDIGFAG